jgi:outer membrane murein-binding lipoprotein Lpp
MEAKRALLLVTCLAIVLAGCASVPTALSTATPDDKLAVAAQTYTATVNALATYRAAGYFTPEEAGQLDILIKAGQSSLDHWAVANKLNQPYDGFVQDLNRTLLDLTAAKTAAEMKANRGTGSPGDFGPAATHPVG